MKRILILRPDRIGDFVIFSGVLKYYHEVFSDYKIDIICHESVKDLAKACPYFDNVFVFSEKMFLGGINRLKFLIFKRNLKKRTYEKAIYPVYSRAIEHEMLLDLIDAKEKIVFDGNFVNAEKENIIQRNAGYTKVIKSSEENINELVRNLEFIRALGFNGPAEDMNPQIWYSEKDSETARQLRISNALREKEYIVCSPGAASLVRLWPAEKWASAVKYLLENTSHKIVFCGSTKDADFITAIIGNIGSHANRIVNLAGKTNLSVLACLIQNSTLLLGIESGPIHLAAAVKTPNICIIGGGHFGRFYPYGDKKFNRIVFKKLDCYGCNWHCRFNSVRCMELIAPEDVIREANILLAAV